MAGINHLLTPHHHPHHYPQGRNLFADEAPAQGAVLTDAVTEEDIAETIKQTGMTREQILTKLGGDQ